MDKFFRKTKGAISIFLVLVMLPMFTCAGLIVDGARISAARTYVTGAGDLAMNAALSEYDQILKDVYGLFAMSSTTEELEANVSRYFSNTINNEGIMQGSDSYTRSFINSIGSLFSTDDVSFDNIVDTQVESFNLVEVPNSALANPTVLERQIIEYMKYRGPVSLGTGLITKLGLIGETSKQTKALEAKVDYEKKLDTVQDACETAYNAINSFNNHMDSTKFKGDYLTALNSDLAEARKLTQEMAQYIIAIESPTYKVSSLAKNSDLEKTVKDEIKALTGENKNMQAYNLLKNKLKQDVEFEVDDDGTYVAKETSYTRAVRDYFSYGPGSTFSSQSQYIVDVKNNMSNFTEMYTYLLLMDDYYDKLTEDEREALAKENEAYATIAGQLVTIVNGAKNASSTWNNTANAKGKAASEKLYAWYSQISGIETKLTDAIEALDVVLEKVDDLDSARTNWSNKVDALSDSEVKTSMESDYSNSAKDMNAAAINALKDALQDNKDHFAKIKEKLDSVKFYGKQICISNYSSMNYFDRYASSIPEFEINASYSLSTRAESIMGNYTNADVKSGITPATYKKITEEQQFYKYLKNVCATVQGESTEETSAKNNRTQLINKGNSDKSADVTGITTGNYVTNSGLTSDISDAIASLAQGNDAGANSFNPTSIDSSGDDDSMADNGKANLTEISNLLTNLAGVAETARDYVYLEEYFTEMFSCYTTGKGSEDLMTLSNKDMSTNKFFGSEMEYILYGKDTVQGNLNCSKASIFGVRFALNSIYALTSSDTRTPALTAATAIAGWTGFGVPIVQTVILLAWSMAESMVDLDNLCKGEAVALYKSSETWVLGINGAIQVGKDAAASVIDDVFTKIENTAMDSIDSLTGTVNEYVENTTEGIVDSIQGTVMTSIETLAMQIVGESNYNLSKSDVQSKVDNMLNSMAASATSDSTADKATRLAIEAIKTTQIMDPTTGSMLTVRDYLVSTIYSAYSDAKEGLLTSVSNKIESMLNSVVDPIRRTITSTVSSIGDELKNEVSRIVSEGGDQVKEKVTAAIDDYLGDLGGTGGGGGTAAASGFSLTYKEYVKAFMLLSITANKNAMLQRCAELIQANISQSNTSFNITKAYTMVEINATVSIRTTFFDIPISSGVDANGDPVYDLDFSNIGSGRQEIKYVGILGY